ncbi:MAG TPA: adenylate/guanylate cyclase domain-containing protein [Candidatus Dormibacteraeota bacterium]|nr:adenylate/guanylate cyclase domain-containing protein [Candidatus Dormibacteraeota bacterium]
MAAFAEERRIVTVLFADMAGSTALGEELDPEVMRRLLARYYAIAREAVEQHGGTVEKFIGDAVMAVFGLPTAHGDDPDRAVAAAVTMRDRIRADGMLKGRLTIRFGVSTGEVVASRDQSAGDFLVTGDATNVAARLQQAAEPWAILVSDRTVRAAVNFEFGDEVDVEAKGKSAPVAARVVVGPRKARAQRRVRLPLVGRETDLAQLQLVARRAVNDRRPSMVSVIAPAGTGKTRLVEEFLDWLPSLVPEAIVATAQCLPYGQQLTYWPMRQVLFALTGTSEDTPPGQVRDAIWIWLRRIGVDDPDRDARLLAATIGEAGTEGVDKEVLFAAWRSALEATARQHPLVIVFEDLHWSSDSLLDLAEFVMQPRGDAAVLMLVLARPELLDRRPNWGGGRLNHLALALEPLASRAIGDLVRHLLDTDEPDVINLVAERSEGNPFYAGELVRSYLEHGSLERLPDTVQATVLARLDLLPPDERRTIQLGSVFGRAFRASGVAALEGGDDRHVLQLCENLADRDLIRPSEGDRYAFRHILIQEVAYGTLPRTERARLHAQAGRWGESVGEGREVALAEILAFHYREAAVLYTALEPGGPDTVAIRVKAAKWLLKAADVAAAAGASPEAVRHIRASFDFVDKELRPRLHERIGDMTAGDAGLEDYRQALEMYEQMRCPVDDQLRAVAGILIVAMRWVGSVGDRPSEEYIAGLRARGRELLGTATDRNSIARFLAADAFFPFWIQGVRDPTPDELALADTDAAQARRIAVELGDPDLESAALDAACGTAQAVSEWAKARDTAYDRMKFGSSLGFYERLDAHSVAAWMSYLMGDLAGADRASADMAARLLPGQAPYPALHLFAWRAMTLYQLGRWDDAVAVFWRAVDAWHDAGSHAAGYGIRGFVVGLDIGRARGDPRLVGIATEVIESILSRFPAANIHRAAWMPYLQGDAAADVTILRYQAEAAERRIGLSCDLRLTLPDDLIERGLEWARRIHVPLVEAQLLRASALAHHDAADMDAAISIWEQSGALTQLGRGRAERGLITGNAEETDSGLAVLKKLGDANYVDRFAARV